MSDTTTQTAAEVEANPAGDNPEGSAANTSGTGAQATPEGFVPVSELSAVEERRRALQSERDRLQSELDAARAASGSGTDPDAGSSGDEFDPESFRRSLMRDVLGATALRDAAAALKTEFPHADPGIFSPERLADFGSPEALRLAASDSHARVATAVALTEKATEEKLRAEYAEKFPGAIPASPGGAAGGTGDPTAKEIAAMTMDELDALENANPGVIDRVLRSE